MHYDRLLFFIIVAVFINNTVSLNTRKINILNRHIWKRDSECPLKCPDGTCILNSFICDGDLDCRGGWDENPEMCKHSCQLSNEFTCDDGECIDLSLKCDGKMDCEDNSDEYNCTSEIYTSNCSAETEFDCGENHCISLTKVCDGIRDCETSKDEVVQTCNKYGCLKNNGGCDHNCTISPVGRVCSCLNGFMLKEDTLCEDIDECKNVSSCSQLCLNEPGTFKCHCTDGYEIFKNNTSYCKSTMGHGYILMSRKDDVRKFNLAHHEVIKVISNTSFITAMDFDFKTETIFWFDLSSMKIYKVSLKENGDRHVILHDVLVKSLAYDWIYKRIYWANQKNKYIEVINAGGNITTRLTLIDRNVDAKAIVLDPIKGWMFWIDSLTSNKIKRAWMDGSHIVDILLFNNGIPEDLVLDFIKERIYWVDAHFHSISSCNYDGSDLQPLLLSINGLRHPFSIALFENSVYWTDDINLKLYKANKLSGEISSFGYINTNDFPIIHVYHQLRQPNGTNYCDHSNCSHHCFPTPNPSNRNLPISCACPDDYILLHDNYTCAKKTCDSLSYACRNSKCISSSLVCDGIDDCDDGEDEINCAPEICKEDEFTCSNGQCIEKSWRCDGDIDCNDGSDEKDCKQICDAVKQMRCEESHECISIKWRCDKKEDCIDGSDEKGCPTVTYGCSDNEYKCKSISKCIPFKYLCDGHPNCLLNDDEDPDVCKNIIPLKKCDSTSEFDCGNSTCISISKVCDHHQDCPNSSDEPPTCFTDFCKDDNGGCAQKCVNNLDGFHCECDAGFELVNGKQCDDENECNVPGTCSQMCINTVGSYSCGCFHGYVTEPHRPNSCRAMVGKPYIIFSKRHDIRMLQLHTFEMTNILSDLKHISALDYYYKTNEIFWTDDDMKVHRTSIDKNQIMNHQILENIRKADDIAVDWIYNRLYWTNAIRGTIELLDLYGQFQIVVIKINLGKPKSITLDPLEGWMFWTDLSTNTIQRAGMDGSHYETIVSHEIVWPIDVTLDLVSQRVYWVDSILRTISSCEYDGTNRRTIIKDFEIRYSLSISIFEDWIYWANGFSDIVENHNPNLLNGKIIKANKFNGKNLNEIIQISGLGVIHIFHPYKQPNGTNHCGLNNGNCSHICLPAPRAEQITPLVSCACPEDLTLMLDGFTCGNEELSIFDETESSGSIAGTVIAVITILLTIGFILGFAIYKRDEVYNRFKNNSRFRNPRYSITDGDHFSIDHDEHKE